jgi:PilZ domain
MSDLQHTSVSDDTGQSSSPGSCAARVPAPSRAGDDLEKRSRPRHLSGTITLTRLSLATVDDASYFAWVHDISESGIGLDVLGRLGAGVDIVFELKGSGENEKIRLHAQVIHATPVGTFFRLGCKFTRPLRPAVLAAVVSKMRGS